jgi:gliding motility-associated protein GldC
MKHSTITIDVLTTIDKKQPASIAWQATDSGVTGTQQAKAMMLGLWDGDKKSALHIDLWVKEMMVDEMADFYYQMLLTMTDTFSRATGHKEFAEPVKIAANEFYSRFGELRKKEMQAKK